jgi:hypothetical protein
MGGEREAPGFGPVRLTLTHPPSTTTHPDLLVSTAILNLNEVENQRHLNKLNNAATILVFITVVINIFITAFGAHHAASMAARTSSNPI